MENKPVVEKKSVLVSVVMATYNRAYIIERAVNSVLNQTYKNIDLIIVDDGSTDNTSAVLKSFNDPRIRVFKHDHNKGVTAAKNTGLDNIKGEWFTLFDSDDEMAPEAIETMINIPLNFDSNVTSVTCNCWEPVSKTFLGHGLDKDGYIFCDEGIPCCNGDYWGLIKTSLLQEDRFNEKLIGVENALWYKLSERAYGYYIHKGLNFVHVDGKDRVSTSKPSFKKELIHFENLINEDLYLKVTKRCEPEDYDLICKKGLILMLASHNKALATRYYNLLKSAKNKSVLYLLYNLKLPALFYRTYLKYKPMIKYLMA